MSEPENLTMPAACVAPGRYASPNEFVRGAVRRFQGRHDRLDAELFFREWNEELDALEAP